MNKKSNIIDKFNMNVYNKNAKRKSSDARARMFFCRLRPYNKHYSTKNSFCKEVNYRAERSEKRMKNHKVQVISESESGRNQRFKDCSSGKEMTRNQFVKEIKTGNYEDYYVRKINNIDTPVSKPDGNEKNNLG